MKVALMLTAFTTDPAEIDSDLAKKLRGMGIEGVICHFGLGDGKSIRKPNETDFDAVKRAGELLRENGSNLSKIHLRLLEHLVQMLSSPEQDQTPLYLLGIRYRRITARPH